MNRCYLTLTLALVLVGWLVGPGSAAAKELHDAPAWTHPAEFLAPEGEGGEMGWPEVRPEARPGAYWWWPGSAVTKEDLTWNLETYRKAGWGNVHVIGIYGVRGEEARFIEVFSPKWFEMFNHAVAEAKRLGMSVDLTPSSGWRMGGPHVTPQHGEQSFAVENGRIVARPNGAKVKRAGPGGEGLAINPYSEAAVAFHLDWMDKHFAEGNGVAPRAFYYDSFENPGNWCPEFLESFRRLRGYSLEEHAEALAGRGEPDEVRRVVCDYRETLSDVLIARVEQIVRWGKARDSGLRTQAHGAPANLLDMYAAAELPETEVFGASQFDIPGFRRDPKWIRPDRQSDLVNRFASSAAHVAGRNVVISESFTWLRNHYHTALSHVKAESDKLLLNGINCIYYHGICFAPKETTWPGWLFYASTQANARNSIFRDVPALNAYVTRCQSVLQEGTPHNDVLLYWPVYDLWMSGGGREQRFSVHHPDWVEKTPCGEAGRWMIDRGYTFDFVSDRQLLGTRCEGGSLRTEGGSEYRTVLVPAAKCMKVETARRLLDLAEAGATVLVWRELPQDVPGWRDHAERKQRLGELLGGVSPDAGGVATVGNGKLVVGDDLQSLLDAAGIAREPLVDHALQFIRRKTLSHVSYFIVNHSAEPVDAWVAVASPCRSAALMDPMTARTGIAPIRVKDGRAEVYLQMQPGETRVLRMFPDKTVEGPAWPIKEPSDKPIPVEGTWRVRFVEGGPVLPKDLSTEELKCWTQLGGEQSERFAGAARYTITVHLPESNADGWYLDLGDVRESARVWVNGRPAGIVVAHAFRVDATGLFKPGSNEITIEVTNLSANRIRDLDRRGVDWKKFHDINFVDHQYKPFDASGWELKPSGLLGPVRLVPYRVIGNGEPAARRSNEGRFGQNKPGPFFVASLLIAAQTAGSAAAPAAQPALPSVQALADRLPCTVDFFQIEGRRAFLLRPKDRTESGAMPWVWYAPVIGHPNPSHAWMLRQWLEKGIGMAGVDVGESFGSPQGRKVYTALWDTLVRNYGMSERPCLLPQSRGGLMLYNWAAENPRRVACIAGVYPVCDLRSYPGLARACGAYGLTAAELEARLAEHNPVERLRPLAEAGVPILHVHGDADGVVPLEKNSAELARRYRELGGRARVIVVPGKGHQVCPEFFQCQELVDFVTAHSREPGPGAKRSEADAGYARYVRTCLDTLVEHGTDTYGEVQTPMLVSILDTHTLRCPEDPAKLDEAFRVTRRGRRNPAASDLETDQALLRTMVLFSAATGETKYADFARRYAEYAMQNLVDDKGFFWWGWHRRYDVYDDARKGHSGDHHELHAIHEIDWGHLWKINPKAVGREIEAIWQWHVVDKQTGEINRHGDGRSGCDFSMSAGAFIEAFAFMHRQTGDRKWLDRARLIANYYWDRRNRQTDLFPERPNAGRERFDGSSFVTAITGLYCHSLLKAWHLSGDETFRDHALAYLRAYAKYGYDAEAGKFWGALRLDGTPIPGPRLSGGYAMYEPRGHLDLWEPYVAGYQHAIYTAQAHAYAYQLTGDAELLTAAKRFADWIDRTPPGTFEGHESAWYHEYAAGPGRQGTYAGKYGRSISFLLSMYLATGEGVYLERARKMADDAIEKLWHNGLFRGHPAKPYYESIDGVGYLLYALLQLDGVLEGPDAALANKAITIGDGDNRVVVAVENW